MQQNFIPDFKKALVIASSDYYTERPKLPAAKLDGDAMNQFLLKYNFDVSYLLDSDLDEIKAKVEEFVKLSKTLGKQQKRAFFFLYYSGHATLSNGFVNGYTVQDEFIPVR